MSRKIALSELLLASLLASSAAMAPNAMAEETAVHGPYLGGAITRARLDGEGSLRDDESNGWKAIVGWRPHENFAFEASYLDFDTIESPGLVTRHEQLEGFDAFAVGLIPLSSVDFFAKAGIASIDSVGGANWKHQLD